MLRKRTGREFLSQANHLLYAALVISFFVYFAPSPLENSIEPVVSADYIGHERPLSGAFHTLLADHYWLLSARRLEQHPEQGTPVAKQNFFKEMKRILTLDPGFTPGLHYGATYLASIYRDVDLSHALVDVVLDYYPYWADLIIFKITQEISYRYPPRPALIDQWLKVLDDLSYPTPVRLNEALVYAREQQAAWQQKDLRWLLNNARTSAEKQIIQKRLHDLESDRPSR
ncbi:MAG: hypothetical protein MJA28_11260 [Gammaproteobacteria bacterium]|nr:hypothetical protein [Gammaproteobacteria bacterium]